MSTTLTNSNLTQIAVKRLSGKAMTNSNSAIPAEKFGSTIQSSATTIFGQSVPNNPSTASADLYRIQSASDGGPGTVQLVTFDVVAIGSEYANTDDSNLYSDEVAVGADTGDSYGVTTFHAYALKLTGSYEGDVTAFGGSDYFANNASTPKVIGTDPEFSNNFISTGSTQFQIVPEYLSTVAGTTNPYIPIVSNTSGDDFYDPAGFISATDGIDYYLDTFAGILFVQDPAQYGTPDADGASQNSGATIPKRVRAFLYTGKYQSEIEGGNFHISGSEGGGFSIAGQVTASFETGSGDGLTITADPNANSLTFQLNDVVSGSAGLIHISASANNGADLGAQQTASFISGDAGLTVRRDDITGGQMITIGSKFDDVHFADITGSNLLITDTASIGYLHTIYETASIIYSSGSTKFGNTFDDTHNFTGSINLSGSIFGWDTPTGNSSTTPLVYDAATGTIHTGSEFGTSEGIYISASDGNGFSILSAASASLTTGSTSGEGLTITANAASSNIEFTLVNVVSSSAQILDGTGILSSSLTNFTDYSSSVETITNALIDSASAGIAVSSSGGTTSIALMETASFIGGDGITITNSDGTLTIESDYGELDSALHISASDGNGTSIAYTATASFSASGPGLTATLDGSEINYDINANTLIEAVDTATVINITASYALSASFITGSDVNGPYGPNSVISASWAETASYIDGGASTVQVLEDNSTARYGVIQSDLLQSDLVNNTAVNEDVTLQGWQSLAFNPGRNQLFVGPPANYVGLSPGNIVVAGTGTTSNTFNFLTTGISFDGDTSDAPETINIGTGSGTVYFQGSASIAGDLIVQGTTTTLNTETLLVEDPYILLASSSATNNVGGGIVIQRGSTTSGTALHWDETEDVWAVALDTANASTATAKTIDFNLVGVKQASGNPTTAPSMGVGDYKLGQMYVNTTDTDSDGNTIWIYAT